MSHEIEILREDLIERYRRRRLFWSSMYMVFCAAAMILFVWKVLL